MGITARSDFLTRDLPASWESAPIAYCMTQVSSAITASMTVDKGSPLFDANSQIGFTDAAPVPREYLTIIKDGAGIGRVRVLPGGTFFTSTMNGLLNNERCLLRWCFYVLSILPFETRQQTTIPHLYFADYARVRLPLPPLDQQDRIVRFLDAETAKIDHLISKQRSLLDLVKQRQGLERDVLFGKYVGKGERLKWNLSETNVRLGDTALNDLPLLSVSIHWGVSPRVESVGEESTAASFEKYKVVEPGDIILNRMRAFQGAVGFSDQNGFTSPDYAVFKPSIGLDPAWLMQVMKTQKFVDEMKLRLTGIGGTEGGKVRTPRINSDDLLDIRIRIPSLHSQQQDILNFQKGQQRGVKIKNTVERHIELAMERRSALITAAVTGQIEV